MNITHQDDTQLIYTVDRGRPTNRLLLTGLLGAILTLGGAYYLVALDPLLGVITLAVGLPLLAWGVIISRRSTDLTVTLDRSAQQVTLDGPDGRRTIPYAKIQAVTVERSGFSDAPFFAVALLCGDETIAITAPLGRVSPLQPTSRDTIEAQARLVHDYIFAAP